ncbi:hypothetical protein FS749_012173 [Ceratobasidium sp. UAMH 11750]|nr:hypothetical protein FS749_012173 [Ceratobasidium sp. UAMH 11750]
MFSVSGRWIRSPPLTARAINQIHSIQLFTYSGHYRGSWSLFEIGVSRLDESSGELKVKTKPSGLRAFWTSHFRSMSRNDVDPCRLHTGTRFGPNHWIWDCVKEGDVLVVEVKVEADLEFSKVGHARKGVLRVDTWWEPSIEMLDEHERSIASRSGNLASITP